MRKGKWMLRLRAPKTKETLLERMSFVGNFLKPTSKRAEQREKKQYWRDVKSILRKSKLPQAKQALAKGDQFLRAAVYNGSIEGVGIHSGNVHGAMYQYDIEFHYVFSQTMMKKWGLWDGDRFLAIDARADRTGPAKQTDFVLVKIPPRKISRREWQAFKKKTEYELSPQHGKDIARREYRWVASHSVHSNGRNFTPPEIWRNYKAMIEREENNKPNVKTTDRWLNGRLVSERGAR